MNCNKKHVYQCTLILNSLSLSLAMVLLLFFLFSLEIFLARFHLHFSIYFCYCYSCCKFLRWRKPCRHIRWWLAQTDLHHWFFNEFFRCEFRKPAHFHWCKWQESQKSFSLRSYINFTILGMYVHCFHAILFVNMCCAALALTGDSAICQNEFHSLSQRLLCTMSL